MMRISPGPVAADHDLAMAWIDEMKRVYQAVLDKHGKSGRMAPRDVILARDHLKALAVIEKTLGEHHEMANGRPYPGGGTRPVHLDMKTTATLILPDGTRRA